MPRKGETVSAEMRARISAALKGRPSANLGRPKSAEHRAKLATVNLGKKASEETKAKMRVSQALRPPKSDETKAKMSVAALGRPKSDTARLAMSRAKKGKPGRKPTEAQIEALRQRNLGKKWSTAQREKSSGRNSHLFGKPPKHKPRVLYAGTLMRSTWEAAFAAHCDQRGARWQYEPTRFDLGDCTYTPDFFLPDDGVYWEVKGWLDPTSQQKAKRFRELNPELPLIVATKPVLQMIGAL